MLKHWLQKLKNIYHYGAARWWRWYWGRPDRQLKIYGITGTNGKTTTSHILASILAAEYGAEKVGMLTTIDFRIGVANEVNKTKMTTLDSHLVFAYLSRMALAGVERVVLEITSHALDQNRLAGIRLDGAIFLNIAREHLDYHNSLLEYARTKLKIVSYLKNGSPMVMNRQFSIFNFQFSKKKQFSIFKRVKKIVFTKDEAKDVDTPLAGEWNKENVLAASKLAKAIGIGDDVIRRGVDAVRQVPGRMEVIVFPKLKAQSSKPKVIIDYAVTPDALENLYREVRKDTMGKTFAVLGAAGLRDRGKRPLMTRAVAQYADEIVLTREDPWTEDEEQIFRDLEEGLNESCKVEIRELQKVTPSNSPSKRGRDGDLRYEWSRIVDRREAIKYCLEKAGSGDVVIVTGKGAEEGMAVGEKIIAWNDKAVILELMEEINE